MPMPDLASVARALVAPGKGILAADESEGTIRGRFQSVGLESSADSRRAYREMLLTTPGIERFISGVILHDETVRQDTSAGTAFPRLLEERGIVAGIKVDRGTVPLAGGAPGETITEGLDGLRRRLEEYGALGARFAKWRATYSIGDGKPSEHCVRANAHALARYAGLCQEAGLVPIVEPEVLMQGEHSIDQSAVATARVLTAVFRELHDQGVDLRGALLKPNMVLSGYGRAPRAGVAEVAARTLAVLGDIVPPALPGVVFLSGGQSDEDATAHLDAMNRAGPQPWQLSFSYARALQGAALRAWQGRASALAAAQRAFYHRARMNGAARSGGYTPELELEAVP